MKLELKSFLTPVRAVGVYVHGIPEDGGFVDMFELKLSLHIFEQLILNDQHQFAVHGLKRLNLVMNLNQDGLRRHFPVDALWLPFIFGVRIYLDSEISQCFLSQWPPVASRVQGL